MYRKHFDPWPYRLLPPDPQGKRALRRPNLIVISVLAYFTIGLLITEFILAYGGVEVGNYISLLDKRGKTVNA